MFMWFLWKCSGTVRGKDASQYKSCIAQSDESKVFNEVSRKQMFIKERSRVFLSVTSSEPEFHKMGLNLYHQDSKKLLCFL